MNSNPNTSPFRYALLLLLPLLVGAVGCDSDDDDPDVNETSTTFSAEIEGVESFVGAENDLSANYIKTGNGLAISANGTSGSERSFLLSITDGFTGNTGTFTSDNDRFVLQFSGLEANGNSGSFFSEDLPAEITISSFSEGSGEEFGSVSGTFSGEVKNINNKSLMISNGQFENLPVTVTE